MEGSHDVIIIGAGPAGSTCAKMLASRDLKVLLLDKQKFPRPKPCGGALTPRVVTRFPHVQTLIQNSIYKGFLHSHDGKLVTTIQTDYPLGHMVRRIEFDDCLVRLAIEQGANFLDAVQVKDVKITSDQVQVKTSEGTFKASVLIGADGTQGIVARKSHLLDHWRPKDLGIALMAEIALDEDDLDSIIGERAVHVHLGGGGAWGYAWSFAKKNVINVGIGMQLSDKIKHKIHMKSRMLAYISMLVKIGILPRLTPFKIQGATVPLNKPLEKTQANRVLLVGDAAGFVNPLSGEGIYYAMSSAELAANVISTLKKK
ncbi:MAG: geranylgeranyl reductase family protein, partial [Candidatus Helarchaeales archaeon]